MGTIIPKEIVKKIGYWDSVNFPQYHGDSDFTYRAKKNGYHIIVDPSLKIFNSVKNSGIEHNGSIKQLARLITDIRSKSNLKRNFRFYRLHAESIRAYIPLFLSYYRIFGGFIKWKILKIFGTEKNSYVRS
jgi:GT2 family glycosyltransferase